MKNLLFGTMVIALFGATVSTSYYCFSNAQTLTWLKMGAAEFRIENDDELLPRTPAGAEHPNTARQEAFASGKPTEAGDTPIAISHSR